MYGATRVRRLPRDVQMYEDLVSQPVPFPVGQFDTGSATTNSSLVCIRIFSCKIGTTSDNRIGVVIYVDPHGALWFDLDEVVAGLRTICEITPIRHPGVDILVNDTDDGTP